MVDNFSSCLFTARDYHFDVVLVDTAGRMQDNEPLMRALAKVSLSSWIVGYVFLFGCNGLFILRVIYRALR